VLLAAPLWVFRGAGKSGPPPVIYVAESFGIASCVAALLMYRWRRRMLAWPAAKQGGVAAVVWLVHIGAFAGLLLSLR
jgi:hypothetical protein